MRHCAPFYALDRPAFPPPQAHARRPISMSVDAVLASDLQGSRLFDITYGAVLAAGNALYWAVVAKSSRALAVCIFSKSYSTRRCFRDWFGHTADDAWILLKGCLLLLKRSYISLYSHPSRVYGAFAKLYSKRRCFPPNVSQITRDCTGAVCPASKPFGTRTQTVEQLLSNRLVSTFATHGPL